MKTVIFKPDFNNEDIKRKEINIVSIIPYDIKDNEVNTDNILDVYYMAKTDTNKLILLIRNYIITEEDNIHLNTIPFFCDTRYDFKYEDYDESELIDNIYNYMKSDLIINSLDSYFISADTQFTEDGVNVSITGIDNTNKEFVTINMSYECLLEFTFLHKYIYTKNFEEDDDKLKLSSIYGYQNNSSEVIKVDFIDSILAIAPMYKVKKKLFGGSKISGNLDNAVVARIGSGEKIYDLIFTYNNGKCFEDNKFRGDTLDSITELYVNDDNYSESFSIDNVKFKDDGKQLIIKAENETDTKIFVFSEAIKNELYKMIIEY